MALAISLFRETRSRCFAQPSFERNDERLRSLAPYREPLFRRRAVDGALDLEEFVDAAHGFAGDRAFVNFARSKNFLLPWLQHAASMIVAGFRRAS